MYIDLIPAIIIILVVLCALTWQGWHAYKRNSQLRRDRMRYNDYEKQRKRMVKL